MKTDPDRRRRDMAVIHIAMKQLGMDDATYRAMLWAVARVETSKDLDYTGLQRVIDHLKKRGFKSRHGRKPKVSADRTAQLAKIEALLTDAGRPWTYITAGRPSLVKRICRVEQIEWANSEQLAKLIAALVIDKQRREAAR